MVGLLLVAGVAVAVFVGFNIGGSSTGVAFGPAVGSNVTTKVTAAFLMSVFALIGGGTLGRGVIKTMGGKIVAASHFNLAAGVVVLFFVGVALLVSNLFGVPASTSMTAVGAIAGMGFAGGFLKWEQIGEIVSWWFVSPIIAFWLAAVIGRYAYPHLSARFDIERSGDPLVAWKTVGPIDIPTGLADGATYGELASSGLVVIIGCYMAFSAGASNVANAVAPLYGANALGSGFAPYIIIGGGAISLGAFTIAARTLETVGSDLTELPILAALVVELISASLIGFLSYIDIPASLAVTSTMAIVGLGWGRATRSKTVTDVAKQAVAGSDDSPRSPADGSERASNGGREGPSPDHGVTPIGDAVEDVRTSDLYDARATGRVIVLWVLTPSIASAASYLLFTLFPLYR
ncbi:inorganic phosphate transporter [Halorussus vallis]|nr:inorganic phosphate transporter [Halorussus vallis]USZ77710.1 inorganic phosphate transporter [Halorussus vallis]